MSNIPSPHFQMVRWARCLGNQIFLFLQRKLYIPFLIFFRIYFGIVYVWPTSHSFDQRIWLTVIFFLSERSRTLFQVWTFFAKLSNTLSQLLLSWTELPKCTRAILMENCGQAICLGLSIYFLYTPGRKTWFFEKFIFELEAFSHNFNIKFIFLKQLKSLKKNGVSSAKFTILISWSPICIPLILVSAPMNITSTSLPIMQ